VHSIEEGGPHFRMESGEPDRILGTHQIRELQLAATRLAWCPSPDAPGLLAVGLGSGLITLLPLDSQLLAK